MKCNNKECQNLFCDSPINHLNRIEGQIKKIKEYVESGEKCYEVANLVKATSSSFESLRNKMLKNFILNEMNKKEKISKKELEKINKIFQSFKK